MINMDGQEPSGFTTSQWRQSTAEHRTMSMPMRSKRSVAGEKRKEVVTEGENLNPKEIVLEKQTNHQKESTAAEKETKVDEAVKNIARKAAETAFNTAEESGEGLDAATEKAAKAAKKAARKAKQASKR